MQEREKGYRRGRRVRYQEGREDALDLMHLKTFTSYATVRQSPITR